MRWYSLTNTFPQKPLKRRRKNVKSKVLENNWNFDSYMLFLQATGTRASSRPRVNIAYLRAFNARASFVPARHLSQKICGRK